MRRTQSKFRPVSRLLRGCVTLLAWLLCLGTPLPAQEPLPPSRPGVPVVFNHRTLFSVYSRLSSYQPAERAQVIVVRLQTLAEDPAFRPAALTVEERANKSEIKAGDLVVATVTEEDAQAVGRPRKTLAAEYAQTLRQALTQYRQERSARSLLFGVFYSLLATAVLIAVFRLMGRAFSRLRAGFEAIHARHRAGAKPGGLDDFFAGHFAPLLLQGLALTRYVITLLLLYSYLAFCFGFFPWTKSFAATLLGTIVSSLLVIWNAFVVRLPNLLFIGVIVFLTSIVLKATHLLFLGIELGTLTFTRMDRELAAPTYRIARILIFALAAVAVFPYIPGSSSPAFQGVSVFAGALFTLGSTSVVANLIAGIVLTYIRPFRIGDRVKIGETVGDVVAKSDMVTRIRTVRNEEITIPNAQVLGAHLINYSAVAQTEGLILHTSVTIGYDTPWRQVHALLLAAARATADILEEPAPFVFQTALGDFAVTYEINAYTDQPDRMGALYSELHQNIQDRFNEAGVEIMSPHYASLRDGNQTTIPPNNLPSDYAAAVFRAQSPDGARPDATPEN